MTDRHPDHVHWSQVAAEWIAWARTPNHDAFWAYRASLLTFIGQGKGKALDVGCGEGRVSRALKECGFRVTAIDPVEELVAAAKELGSADDYKVSGAADLPFEERFEAVQEQDGLRMHFAGWSQPLENYMAALENAGLEVSSLREPVPEVGDAWHHLEKWRRVPLFLWLRAIPVETRQEISGSRS